MVSNTTELIVKLDAGSYDVVVLDYVMPGQQYGDGDAACLSGPPLPATAHRDHDHAGFASRVPRHAEDRRAVRGQQVGRDVTSGGRGACRRDPGAVPVSDRRGAAAQAGSGAASNLSKRESEIVRLFRRGYKVTEIAEKLHRSKKTISAQKLAAMRKLGITRDADLIRYRETVEGLDVEGLTDARADG